MTSRLRIAALCGLGLIALVVAAVMFALHSPWFLRTALNEAVARSPVSITVGDIDGTLARGFTLRDVAVDANGTRVTLDAVALRAALAPLVRGTLRIETLTLTQLAIAPGPPTASPATPAQPFSLPLLKAPLTIDVNALRVDGITLSTLPERPVRRVQAAVSWQGTQFALSNVVVEADIASLNANSTLDTADGGRLKLDARWTFSEPQANGELALHGPLDELVLGHTLGAPRRVQSDGVVRIAGHSEPVIELVHRCQEACGTPELGAANVRLEHTGTVTDTRLRLSGKVSHARAGDVVLELDALWRDGALNVEQWTAEGPAVAAKGSAQIQTQDAVRATLATRIKRLDAAVIANGVRGDLRGDVRAALSDGGKWRADLTELEGRINDYELRGSARLNGAGQAVTIDSAQFALGDNTARATGSLAGDQVQADVALALPALAQVDARLQGQAEGTLRVSGTTAQPVVKLDLTGRGLEAGSVALDRLDANVTAAPDGALAGRLEASGVSAGGQDYGNSELMLSGTLAAPVAQLTWQADAPLRALAVDARVALERDDAAWLARLESAQVQSAAIGEFALEAPFASRIEPDGRVALEPHVWQGQDARIDVRALTLGAQATTLRAALSDLPLASFDPFLPDGVAVRGTARANIDLSNAGGQWQGNLSWAQSGTLLRLRNEAASRRVAFDRVAINAVLTQDVARAAVDIEGEHGASVKASVAATSPAALAQSPLQGSLDVRLDELGWLAAFVPGIDELGGRFSLGGGLAGRVDAPRPNGQVSLSDGVVAFSDAGVRLTDVGLTGTLDEALRFAGQANSGGGTLELEGEVQAPFASEREARVRVTGQDVQVLNDARYQVRASPDIELLYSVAKGAAVRGQIEVPSARVRIDALPESVVAAAPDIRVAGRAPDSALALPVAGQVALILGQDVKIDALGLDAALSGQVDVTLVPAKPPRLVGRLALEDGTFAAYGQKLAIERGNVIYAGPIDNPTLDVRATRSVTDSAQTVKAGVAVTGPAAQPDIALYSEPALSETDTLSYLLLGRAANDTSEVDGAALSQAALSLGLSRSSPLTQQLADGMGLDELTVGGDSVDAAELVAGKQINDRLYVRYSYGVFSNLGAILLRYRLSQRLTLEAGSADAQSIDVLYTIEK